MESIKKIYKIGYGPSSSHTMGPAYASINFKQKNPFADRFDVYLYGSLANTGKGHLTDVIIKKVLYPTITNVYFDLTKVFDYHPNAMIFKAYQNNKLIDEEKIFSVGGGDLKHEGENRSVFGVDVYPHHCMDDILRYCHDNNLSLIDYISKYEDQDLYEYFEKVYNTMKIVVHRGILNEGILPGGLNVQRKAPIFYRNYIKDGSQKSLQYAYALAAAEENAEGSVIVTAPTCGSCGVIPAILFTEEEINHLPHKKLLEGLMIAGLIGNLVKTNASISGAEVGCQGEIGVACSMAAAMIAYLKGAENEVIEYAAENALEHHLGMTCDPIDGLVQIPCIERNAIASFTAVSSAEYAIVSGGKHYVSLDSVIDVMRETGKDLHCKYRETSTGGLALKKNDR